MSRPKARRLPVVSLLVLLCLVFPGGAHAIDTSFLVPQPRPFAPTSPFNAPLASTLKPSAQSGTLSATLRAHVASYGTWINSYAYSTPVYTVPAGQPRVKVILDRPNPILAAAYASVPLPPTVRPATGSDAHLVLVQPSTNHMWEFFKLRKATDGWHAAWGADVPSLSTHSGAFTGTNFGATASGLSLLAGLPRMFELDRGSIDHAVALAVPQTRKGAFTAPAVRTDGSSTAASSIPMGTRFRIDPALDLATLTLSPIARMLAVAAQRYGMIVRDTTSSTVAFEIEDPKPAGIDQNARWFGGQSAGKALAGFPWSRVQVVTP